VIAIWEPEGSLAITLCAGAAEGQPMFGLAVKVSRTARGVAGADSMPVTLSGSQTIEVSFSTPASRSAIPTPLADELGSLRLVAPDGAWSLLSPAAIASRRATALAGDVLGWTYTVVASGVFSASSEYGGVLLTDGLGRILTDGAGNIMIRPFIY